MGLTREQCVSILTRAGVAITNISEQMIAAIGMAYLAGVNRDVMQVDYKKEKKVENNAPSN